MERCFNTAGPNAASMQYTLNPLERFDLDEMIDLISQSKYFVLHAPRQSCKTSYQLALRDYLNKQGDYIAVYANVEGDQALRNATTALPRLCGKAVGYLAIGAR